MADWGQELRDLLAQEKAKKLLGKSPFVYMDPVPGMVCLGPGGSIWTYKDGRWTRCGEEEK